MSLKHSAQRPMPGLDYKVRTRFVASKLTDAVREVEEMSQVQLTLDTSID